MKDILNDDFNKHSVSAAADYSDQQRTNVQYYLAYKKTLRCLDKHIDKGHLREVKKKHKVVPADKERFLTYVRNKLNNLSSSEDNICRLDEVINMAPERPMQAIKELVGIRMSHEVE